MDEHMNACKKCKSLFFIDSYYFCESIYDPDCEFSDGIHNKCVKCANGIILDSMFSNFAYDEVFCSQYERVLNK